MTHTYDEIPLKDSLSRLSRPKVIAFAAAAATRQTRNYESFAATVSSGALARYHEIVNLLWANASTQALDQSVWSELVDEITSYLDDVEATAEKQWLYAADDVPGIGVASWFAVLSGLGREWDQLAASGRPMSGSSLIAAMVSRDKYLER
jgi:hypothetical protein